MKPVAPSHLVGVWQKCVGRSHFPGDAVCLLADELLTPIAIANALNQQARTWI